MSISINTKVFAVLVSGSMALTGCANANNAQKGAGIGAAAGAILGGIIGNNVGNGNTAVGAVIGGAVGGIAGGVIGKNMDKQAKEIQQALPGAEVERVGEGIKVTLKENTVNFNFNSADLTPASKANLDKLAEVLKNNPDTNISVFGHTDSKGADEYNLALSKKRADAVAAYLATKGISRNRVTPTGVGESQPIGDNQTEAGRAQNRRVEFAITANEKMIEEAQQLK